VETLVQNTEAFNAQSRGCIRMTTNQKPGHFDYEAFFKNTSGLINRRDIAAVTSVTDNSLTQDEFVKVKLNRRIGPVAQTLDSFRKIGSQAGVNSLSFLIGTQIAKAQIAGWLNDALLATRAHLVTAASATVYEDDTAAAITSGGLVDAMAKFGDAAERIGLWVMHSKAYFDLVKDQMTNYKLDTIAGAIFAEPTPRTFNRPVLVTDSSSLVVADGVAAGVDAYYTLGLTAGAVTIEQTEEQLIHAELITGLENIVVRLQGEYAWNLGLKGAKWDVANGGLNPDATALGTATNWDVVMADRRDLAGVCLATR
jgi:hypothetical protein